MTSLVETCLPTKHNMADKECDCPNDALERQVQNIESRLKGPEKDLQTIFKKLRVDNGPKRLQRKARLGGLNNLSRDKGSKQIARRILREPTFIYKNQQASTMVSKNQPRRVRRRRRKMSLELKSEGTLKDQRDSLSDSELECNKSPSVKNISLCNANKERKVEPQKPYFQSREMAADCSRQHRRLQGANVQRHAGMNFDDTTPEELAAYFDQLLYFPKPMSAMAEMMYT